MVNAIIATFECPSCGSYLEEKQLLKVTSTLKKYSFEAPKWCDCGRTSNFKLISFKPVEAEIKITNG